MVFSVRAARRHRRAAVCRRPRSWSTAGSVPGLGVVPNGGWERVVGGHRDEWRTRRHPRGADPRQSRPGARPLRRVRRVTAASDHVLARLEDLRAANESFVTVPLSDPRPAGGPLFWDPCAQAAMDVPRSRADLGVRGPRRSTDRRGRVHVRLSPTHLRAPATRDYDGPTDPNQVGLALSAEGRVAVTVGASNTRAAPPRDRQRRDDHPARNRRSPRRHVRPLRRCSAVASGCACRAGRPASRSATARSTARWRRGPFAATSSPSTTSSTHDG